MSTRTTAALHEEHVIESVRVEDAWTLVEEFSELVRESGTDDERKAVEAITRRLEGRAIPFTVHEPELLISLPRGPGLSSGGHDYYAKTPSMASSTPEQGLSALLTYEPSHHAASIHELFENVDGEADVRGKFVVTEGLPMPSRVRHLESRGSAG